MATTGCFPRWLGLSLILAVILCFISPSTSGSPVEINRKAQQILSGSHSGKPERTQANPIEEPDNVHPYAIWLHNYLRGIGKQLSSTERRGGQPGSHLAGSLLREPLLHPDHIILAHQALANDTEAEEAPALEPKEIDINSNIYMDEGAFAQHAEQWMQHNRELMEFCLRWMLLGGLIFVAATSLIIYSEVRMVCLTRDIDACIVNGEQMDRNLMWRKDKVENWRGYMTFGGIFFLVVSLCMMLFPLCRMASALLLSMGYVFSGCYALAFCMAFLVAIIWALFVIGLCWVCTRPWTGGILIFVAFLGECALESEAAPAIVLWVLVSLLFAWVWIKWGKSLVTETPYTEEERQKLLPTEQ